MPRGAPAGHAGERRQKLELQPFGRTAGSAGEPLKLASTGKREFRGNPSVQLRAHRAARPRTSAPRVRVRSCDSSNPRKMHAEQSCTPQRWLRAERRSASRTAARTVIVRSPNLFATLGRQPAARARAQDITRSPAHHTSDVRDCLLHDEPLVLMPNRGLLRHAW
jgi:hypothetical protein